MSIREYIEGIAFQNLYDHKRRMVDIIEEDIRAGSTPLQIAQKHSGGAVILGCVYLLAANYMIKGGIFPPEKEFPND